MSKTLLRDPLLHFVLLGGLIFAAKMLFTVTDDDRTIAVGETQLVNFMQYRERQFNSETATQALRSLPEAEKQALVERYVEEEALFREATRMELDRYDYVARLRLVQQMEFLLASDLTADESEADDEVLQQFWRENHSDYREPAAVTFTHVFVRDNEGAQQRAQALLQTLKEDGVPAEKAGNFGDRAPYFLNYVQKTEEQIDSFLGREFAAVVFSSSAQPGEWMGPVRSRYGSHLVLISNRQSARDPEFSEIRARLFQDYRQQRERDILAQRRKALVESYDVRVQLDDEV